MNGESLMKLRREAYLDRFPDAGHWRNRYFSAAALTLWSAATKAMAGNCRGRVLDAGSGRGAWKSWVVAHADLYESIDLEPRGGAMPTWIGDLAHMPAVPSARYDAAICHQVLEHLPDPERALAEFRRVLVPGGTLILSAPHLSRLHELPHDYFRYTPNGLRALLQRAGFAEPRVLTYGGPLSFLHHQVSFVFPGLLTPVPMLGTAAAALNALFSISFAWLDRLPPLARLLPLGVLAVARAPA